MLDKRIVLIHRNGEDKVIVVRTFTRTADEVKEHGEYSDLDVSRFPVEHLAPMLFGVFSHHNVTAHGINPPTLECTWIDSESDVFSADRRNTDTGVLMEASNLYVS